MGGPPQHPDDSDSGAFPDCPRLAVGAVVLRGGRVLLVKRGRPPAANEWAIPGGRVQLGESLQKAAEREVLEETGVRIRAGSPVFVFDAIEMASCGRVRFHYVVVDLVGEYLGGEIRPGDDALDAGWMSPEDLAALSVSPTTRRLLADMDPGRWQEGDP